MLLGVFVNGTMQSFLICIVPLLKKYYFICYHFYANTHTHPVSKSHG